MSWGNSQSDSTPMSWRPRLKEYRNNTGLHTFNHTELTARSYGTVFLAKIGNKLILNTSVYYFHVQEIKRICKALKIKIDVEVRLPCSLLRFKIAALPILYSKLADLEADVKHAVLQKRCESRRGYWKREIRETLELIREIRALGAKFPQAKIKKLKKQAIQKILKDQADLKERRQDAARRVAAGRALLKASWKNINL